MGQALQTDIENLPLHTFQEANEPRTKPCAEIVLTENLAKSILEQGLMPLISFRDSDRIRILRIQSISSTANKLCGRW
jgi:predicted component of type VI protein secretion system